MKYLLISFLFLLSVIFESCQERKENRSAEVFMHTESTISTAERFSIQKFENVTVVKIMNPWQGANNINHVYNLVKRGSELPDGLDSSNVIFVPLRKIICMSTTHIAMISALGEENSIAGISGKEYIFTEGVVEKIKKGCIEDVGYETSLNKELIIKIAPDLIMMYGIGSESASYTGKLGELGMKILFNADYLETNPLGKAEWIKLFGALYCKELCADSIFNSEVGNYNKLKIFINESIPNKPKVLLGLPYKETWYVSPGNSFISRLIEDAGGSYLWKDTESSVSMPFGIENVYIRALEAEYWLNTGTACSLEDISAIDNRLAGLPCFRTGNLYNNNKRVTPGGGNDYWESGTVYPHLILKDIASILHPGIFNNYELYFYQKISDKDN